ncbi:MAG: M48 family metalloprotease [Firmicutes bacterium]|nr:M48 family metalloprotease [Bacillota bacterium]
MLNAFRIAVLAAIVLVNWFIVALFFALLGLGDAGAMGAAALVCGGLIVLAFTPAGEWWFRLVNGFRDPRPEERAALEPLLTEVAERAGLDRKPQLFVWPVQGANACAIGLETVAVTPDLMRCPEEMVKGVLAHEAGHLKNGDTKILAVAYVMNAVGSLATWAITVIVAAIGAVQALAGSLSRHEGQAFFNIGMGIGLALIAWWLRFVAWVLKQVLELSFRAVGRAQEYAADAFAARAGYREGLLAFLRLIEAERPPRAGLAAALYATHPSPRARIERLMRHA